MALDWSQVTLLVGTFGTSLGAAIGLPIANALRRPAIKEAIEKESAISAKPLEAKDDEQERKIAVLEMQLAHAVGRITFLEQAILNWKPRAPEPPSVVAEPAPP